MNTLINCLIDTIEKEEYVFLKYNLNNRTLVSVTSKNKLKEEMTLGKIQIMGVNKYVNKVMINNKQVKYTYDKKRLVSKIMNKFVV